MISLAMFGFWCLDREIYLTACHVAGVSNTEADEMSRSFNDDIEWSLYDDVHDVFEKLECHFPDIEVDLFASRLNRKKDRYVSRMPEPDAFAIDAFTLEWSDCLYYAFPPFSLINRVLQKVAEDEAEMVLVAPLWPTQVWWAALLKLISVDCYLLPPATQILHLPHKPSRRQPLTKMKMAVFKLSGKPSKNIPDVACELIFTILA